MTTQPAEDRVISIDTLDTPGKDRALTPMREREVREEDPAPAGGGWAIVLGFGLAVIWVAGAGAYLVGFAGLSALTAFTPTQMAGLGFIVLAPALFVLLAGMAVRQMVRFGAQARLMTAAARRLTQPDATLKEEAQELSAALAGEVARVNTGMDAALARLGAMEEIIRHHADSLASAATDAGARSRSLIDDLKTEREALDVLANTLDSKAKLVAEAIAEQSAMVARAAELAQEAAQDGKTQIEAGAATLEDASGKAQESGRGVAEALETQRRELSALAESFNERGDFLERVYQTHREEMTKADTALREEQKRIASALDFHRAELGELVKVASKGASDLNDATHAGGAAMRAAVEEAVEQANQISETINDRAQELSHQQHERLRLLDAAAEKARASAEAACKALELQTATMQERVDQLGETTFEAASRAEQVFQRRLDEAGRAMDKVTRLADEADASLADRFERSLDNWRERMGEVDKRLDGLEANLSKFPDSARQQVQDLESALRKGVDGLRSAARASAEEAKEIDSALHARMRHNYELLSEFILRMGTVAGAGGAAPAPAPESLNDLPDPLERNHPEPDDPPESPRSESEPGWNWRDLVSGLRETENAVERPVPHATRRPAPAPEREPAPSLEQKPDADARETPERLGADPYELTPAQAREAARARRSSGIGAMRDAVREHARDHVDKLANAMTRDANLHSRAERMVAEMEETISEAAREDGPDRLIDMLVTLRGRGYLLLSAALGEA